jgi:hypothetical protein
MVLLPNLLAEVVHELGNNTVVNHHILSPLYNYITTRTHSRNKLDIGKDETEDESDETDDGDASSPARLHLLLVLCQDQVHVQAFRAVSSTSSSRGRIISGRYGMVHRRSVALQQQQTGDDPQDELLQTTFGGYTVKQRLREEIESLFRTVRLAFFGSSAVSAFLALYFSATNAIRANMGYAGGPSFDESLESCAINIVAAVVCSGLTYRDYLAGQANLARIAKGGALAKLQVMPAATAATASVQRRSTTTSVKDYRRSARVLVAAGGPEYISTLARSLNSDQKSNVNNLPQLLEQVDVILIPVLLESETRLGDTEACCLGTVPADGDRNFDMTRSNNIVAFPKGNAAWLEYLESEIETAQKQGFDVLNKGWTIFIKKNGWIL